MAAYYNERDDYAADWLERLIAAGLIAPGYIDRRSIEDVRPEDLDGYAQHHFFAGIGGWSRALRIAGWPDDAPVWSGSCPCQPFSSAGRGRGKRAGCERHLWPVWRKLIAAKRPRVVFGEQVAQAADWHSATCDDLEADGYAVGSAHIPAVSVGRDHTRFRFYFVGYAHGEGESIRRLDDKMAGVSRYRCFAGGVVPENGIPARMASMRGFGNAIDPEVAAAFIAASHEAICGIH